MRHPAWKWIVCVVLLLATMLMYMDRLTVAQLARQIKDEFQLNETQYGALDAVFSIAFAFGALFFGWLVDRGGIFFIYPVAVLAWSLAGAITGLVPAGSFFLLMSCRFLLGGSEAGHWPCALRTTQHIFTPEKRTLANSILQSGAAIGSVVTPLVILVIYTQTESWRLPFLVIGSLGVFWVAAWFLIVRPADLPGPQPPPTPGETSQSFLHQVLRDRRFWILVIVVTGINSTWHFFRVWMPRLLDRTHSYSFEEIQLFVTGYYIAADVGSLAAGFGTVWLVRRGMTVHGSRLFVFALCALLTTLSFLVIFLPSGPLLTIVVMTVGVGALGLFPPYYSFSQELTVRNQGKLTGLMGFIAWTTMAPLRILEGAISDATGSFAFGIGMAGAMPIIAVAALYFFWPTAHTAERSPQQSAS